MKRYNIYYRKYNIIANDYIPYIKIVHTDDIYHEIGKIICTSLEKVENIRYTEAMACLEKIEQIWKAEGYRKLTNDIWIMDEIQEAKQ